MLKFFNGYLFILLFSVRLMIAQNPQNIVFPSPQANPPYLTTNSYTRAVNSIKMQTGFKYGFNTGSATNILNLSLGTAPTFVNSGYLGSGANPMPVNTCGTNPTAMTTPVGEVGGKFSVSSSGAAVYEIPILLPEGTRGLQPNLMISYNSQMGVGLLGAGWSLNGLSSICRISQNPIQDAGFTGVQLTTADVYSMDGNRLFGLAGTYGSNNSTYYTEREEFQTITSLNTAGNGPERFLVKNKDGLISEYGYTADSRLVGIGSNTTVHSWYLNKVIDEFGNYVLYTYKLLLGELVIDKIEYTGNASAGLSPYSVIKFCYMPIAEKSSSFIQGVEFKRTQLLKSIKVTSSNELVREYLFDYIWSDLNTYLFSVKLLDADCNELSPTTFCWRNPNEYNGQVPSQLNKMLTQPSDYSFLRTFSADLDGDGFADYVCLNEGNGGNGQLRVFQNTYKATIGSSNNDINFTQIATFPNQIVNLSSVLQGIVTDSDLDGKQEVYIVMSDPQGAFLHSNGIFIMSNKWFILKIAQNSSGLITVSQVGGINQTSTPFITQQPQDRSEFYYNVGDFTGDGTNDEVKIDNESISLNAGGSSYSYVTSVVTVPPIDFSFARPFNMDDDGKIDFVFFKQITNRIDVDLITFNGSTLNYVSTTPINFPTLSGGLSSIVRFVKKGDFNGDGLDDLVYLNDTRDGIFVLYGTGIGFTAPVAAIDVHPVSSNFKLSVNDINNDGKSDVIIVDKISGSVANYYTYVSIGHCLANFSSFAGNPSLDDFLKCEYEISINATGGATGKLAITNSDLNGDGVLDITSFNSNASDLTQTNASTAIKAIYQITTPFRNNFEIHYGNLTSELFVSNSGVKESIYKKQSTTIYQTPVHSYKPNIYCVNGVINYSGLNNQLFHRQKYSYFDGLFHSKGKGFLGFEQILSFDEFTLDGELSINSLNTQFMIPLNVQAISGKCTTNVIGGINFYSITQTISSKRISTFQISAQHAKSYFLGILSSENKDFLNSTQKNQSWTYDLTKQGNITNQTINYAWTGNPLIRSVANDYTFILNNGNYKLQNKIITQTQSNSSPYIRTIDYNYDSQGHLISIINDQGVSGLSNNILTTNFTQYTLFGTIKKTSVSAPDIAQRNSEVNYDQTGRYIVKRENHLGDIEEFSYDKFGNIIMEKDIRGLITLHDYDAQGRLKYTKSPLNVESKVTYNWESPSNYQYSQNDLGIFSRTTETEDNGYSKIYYCSSGEVLREESLDYAGQVVIKDRCYNTTEGPYPCGLLLEESEPHYTNQTKFHIKKYEYELTYFRPLFVKTYTVNGGTPVYSNLFTQTNYNIPSTLNSYNDGYTQTVDQTGQTIKKIYNSAGQLTDLINSNSTTSQKATYSYHSNGLVGSINLTTPSNVGQNILHSYTYNDLGQRVQSIDPSLGTQTFQYNTLGDLLQKSSLNGNFSYLYDVMGKVISKTGNQTGTTTYQYLSFGPAKRKLWKVTSQNEIIEYTYDSFARIIKEQKTIVIGNKTFTSDYTYDKFNRETSKTYPSGFVKVSTYNSYGHLALIKDGTNQTVWQLIDKDALGRIKEYSYGNGLTTKNTYDDMNFLKEIDHGNNAKHRQIYDFNPLTGNLRSRQFENYITNITLKDIFSYDNLDRLIHSAQQDVVTNAQYNGLPLTFDVLGNITYKGDAGTYNYNNQGKPFTLSQITNATSNLSPNTLNVQYNDFDKISHLSEMGSNKQMDFIYGDSQERIKMEYSIGGTNQYTRYYFKNFEREETGASYKEWTYINTPSGLGAVHFNNNGASNLYYSLNDYLGSPVLLMSSNSTNPILIEEYSFDSWGRRRNPGDWSYNNVPVPQKMTRGYTLHEHLDEFSMINMNGRIYDPIIGRFIQADKVIQAPSFLQNFNPYSYCFNNPLKLIDPSGYTASSPPYFNYYSSSQSSSYGSWAYGNNIGSYSSFGSNISGAYNSPIGYGSYNLSSSYYSYNNQNYSSQFITNTIGYGWASTSSHNKNGHITNSSNSYAFSFSYRTENPLISAWKIADAHRMESERLRNEYNAKYNQPVNWSMVNGGIASFAGGAIATVGGVFGIATVGGSPAGVTAISLGIPSMGFGIANIIEGARGSNNSLPGGVFEATDIGFGGDGTIGQIGDIFSGGLPKNIVEGGLMLYGISTSNFLHNMNTGPGGQSYYSPYITPQDNTSVNNFIR